MAGANAAKTFAQRWIIPDVYPIMGVIGCATTICAAYSYRTLTTNPDVVVNKGDRALHLQGKTARQDLYVNDPSARHVKAGTYMAKDFHKNMAELPRQI